MTVQPRREHCKSITELLSRFPSCYPLLFILFVRKLTVSRPIRDTVEKLFLCFDEFIGKDAPL